MKAAAVVVCLLLIGKEVMMTNGRRSLVSCRLSFGTGTTGQVGEERKERTRHAVQPFHEATHQSEGSACSALCFYGNLPPGLHYSMLDLISTMQHNKWRNGLVCCPHILPTSLLPLRPGCIRLCSQTTGPSNDGKWCLWPVSYGAETLSGSCASFLEA